MAKIELNKQHPLYQEELERILEIPEIERIKGKSFLITGATGLIGTCLIDALMCYNHQDADIQIYAVGRSWDKAKSRFVAYEQDDHFHFIEQEGYSVAMQAILDNTRLLSVGYSPLYSFKNAIHRTLNILANH